MKINLMKKNNQFYHIERSIKIYILKNFIGNFII
jgi:hypothetical protein